MAELPKDITLIVWPFYFEFCRANQQHLFELIGVEMIAKSIECKSKDNLISCKHYMYGNENICPFTLESIEDCKTNYSIDDIELCFFMFERCYFSG
jgi:hypothetical protein